MTVTTAEAGQGLYPMPALADFECKHGRLGYDASPPCGCWDEPEPEDA